MGNTLDITKACKGVSEICTEQINIEQYQTDSVSIKKPKMKSTEQIKQKIIKYVQQNRLQTYSVREKKVLQTLVSVGQQHVGDKIIQMDKRLKLLQQQKRQLSRVQRNYQSEYQNDQQKNNNLFLQQGKIKGQKLAKVEEQYSELKQKRKRLFQQAECLLLQDLDMILEQIPNFDQNYHTVNSIITFSQFLLKKNQQQQDSKGQNEPLQKNTSQQQKTHQLKQTIKGNQVKPTIYHQDSNLQHQKRSNHYKYLHPIKNMKQRQYEKKLKQSIRIQDKKVLKKNPQIAQLGTQVLRNNDLLIIVPIECFSGKNVLGINNQTGLPSGASLLQILGNKIRAVNLRRGCTLAVVFLVNQKYLQMFNKEISQTAGFQYHDHIKNVVNQDIKDANNLPFEQNPSISQQSIRYRTIPYHNIWPSFDFQNKIMLSSQYNNQNKQKTCIDFSSHDGDLVGFIENSIQLKNLIDNYQYINLTNINNMLSQIGDIYALGFLEMNNELDIVTKVLKPENIQVQLERYFELDEKGFVNLIGGQLAVGQINKEQADNCNKGIKDKICQQKKYVKNRAFLNTEQYYVKSRIFRTDSGPLKRLLMARITRSFESSLSSQQVTFYLHRSFSSIQYHKFSAFLLIDEQNQFSHAQNFSNNFNMNGAIGYSRYCKKLLGLGQNSDAQQEQMVEIDAGILHKGSQEMMKILKQLRKVKEVGFPIILYSNNFNNQKHQKQA